jgi:hypothetical protein
MPVLHATLTKQQKDVLKDLKMTFTADSEEEEEEAEAEAAAISASGSDLSLGTASEQLFALYTSTMKAAALITSSSSDSNSSSSSSSTPASAVTTAMWATRSVWQASIKIAEVLGAAAGREAAWPWLHLTGRCCCAIAAGLHALAKPPAAAAAVMRPYDFCLDGSVDPLREVRKVVFKTGSCISDVLMTSLAHVAVPVSRASRSARTTWHTSQGA